MGALKNSSKLYCTTVLFVKGTVRIDNMIKIYFIALNEFRRIQLQFATNRIKKGPLEPEIQPAKFARRHYAGPMTSRDVIGLPPVTISLVILHNCFLIVEDYTKDLYHI